MAGASGKASAAFVLASGRLRCPLASTCWPRLCNSRRRRGGFISLDEIAVLDATVAGDAAAVEDLRNAFGFSDADGNGLSTTKLMHVL